MKKTLKTFLLFLITATCNINAVSAQVVTKGSSHIFIGYTYPDFISEFVQAHFGGSFAGPFTLAYQYGLLNRLAIGVQAAYSTGSTAPVSYTDDLGQTHSYSAGYSVFALSLKADYHYLKNKKIDLYSGGSIGYGKANAKITGDANIQLPSSIEDIVLAVNVLGARYMFTPHFGAFAEAGIGTLGIATFGLSAKLGTEKKSVRAKGSR